MTAPATILPDPARLHLMHLATTATAITAVVATAAASALCPLCGRPSVRVHSRYIRSVADMPWHGVPFRLRLPVRRFYCDEPTYARVIFAERLRGLVAPHARRTERLDAWLRAVGFALGGEAGTRLLRALGALGLAGASPDTLLRQVRRAPSPAMPAPHVVGVDDWGFVRGRRYGAILVDLERRQVLDLLPDREAATVAAWLQAHPSSAGVSRDRGGSFGEGAPRGAPQAIQVADRFHVLKNRVETFQQVLRREHAALRAAAEAVTSALLPPTTRPLTAPERHARETAQMQRQVCYETVRPSEPCGPRARPSARSRRSCAWARTPSSDSCEPIPARSLPGPCPASWPCYLADGLCTLPA